MSDRRAYGLLSKRAKQILGEEVPSGGACTAPPADAAQKEKRRSQVLRAQRTHRQRTQTYIKMLEREVLRLRESERAALATVDSQRQQLDALLRERAGGAGSSTPPADASSAADTATGRVTASLAGARGVQVAVQFAEAEQSPASASASASDAWTSLSSLSSPGVPDLPPLPEPEPAPLLADPRVGIEFVLRLETDCMDHLRGKHLDHVHAAAPPDSAISGHLGTAALALWQRGGGGDAEDEHISGRELERLLSSSLHLGLAAPEITPVQVWNRVRWRALPGGAAALEGLTRELKAQTFCVGFGAVLNEAVVEDILKRYYPGL